MGVPPRNFRAELYLDPDHARRLDAMIDETGHVRADVVHHWLVVAAQGVRAGRGRTYPPTPAKAARGTREEPLFAMRFTTSREEWDLIRDLLESVQSSPRAVVEADIDLWEQAGCVLVNMRQVGDSLYSWQAQAQAS